MKKAADNTESGYSNRIAHAKGVKGYCVICGDYGKLSKDHVPPQGAITIRRTEQHHITEMLAVGRQKKIKGAVSNNGSKFRTICGVCNNQRIGECDNDVKVAHGELTGQIRHYFGTASNLLPLASCDVDAVRYSRAMIGHVLSATSNTECAAPPQSSTYFDPLKKFVLGDDGALSDSHEIYYWFYPHERHISAKYVGFYNNGALSSLSLLSFFPIAFMIAAKGKASYPAQARRLDFGSSKLYLDLSWQNISHSAFPFIELEGIQMCLLSDFQCITSKAVV